MTVRRFLIPLVLALFTTRCADDRLPTAVDAVPGTGPHMLRWAGTAGPQFQPVRVFRGTVSEGLHLSAPSGELSLDRYTANFWAVRGEPRSVQINYVAADGSTAAPFLLLENVDPAAVPDRGTLQPGDSVAITITIDPSSIALTFEPHGLLFHDPALLHISYSGAAGDLNGDGVDDDADALIEQQLLGMWYRPDAGQSWTPISAARSLSEKAFSSALEHFSQYAISW